MAKLTASEKHLLMYPPTEQTWVCKQCEYPMSGSQAECWNCHKSKPARPLLLWPKYLVACAKEKIEPGTRWPVKVKGATSEDSLPPVKVRRKRAG